MNKLIVELFDRTWASSTPTTKGLIRQVEAELEFFITNLFKLSDLEIEFANFTGADRLLKFDVMIRGYRDEISTPVLRRICMALPTFFDSRSKLLGCGSMSFATKDARLQGETVPIRIDSD